LEKLLLSIDVEGRGHGTECGGSIEKRWQWVATILMVIHDVHVQARWHCSPIIYRQRMPNIVL
jgi:hypothetical protein